MSFQTLGLESGILKAITDAGYTEATPIQMKAIPEVMLGKHVMASAQTGTGKTAAFVLPILNELAKERNPGRGPRVLIVSPTRELANQITDSIKTYARFLKINSVTVTGGMSYKLQNRLLSKPLDILIATPGRLLDLIQQGKIKLKDTQVMVLDEADRMLDMGFIPDIRKIYKATSKQQQMLMFSATFDSSIAKIAHEFLKDPVTIAIKPDTKGHINIEQSLILLTIKSTRKNYLRISLPIVRWTKQSYLLPQREMQTSYQITSTIRILKLRHFMEICHRELEPKQLIDLSAMK